MKLEIIYEDEYIWVVNKPSGLLSVPGRTPDMQDCVVNRLKEMYPDCPEQPSVHRLDMDTSGLLVMARNKEIHRLLSIQFQNREVDKLYIAILEGVVEKSRGVIELPFRLDPNNRPYQVLDRIYGKMGTTYWRNLGLVDGQTCIEFKPITGRTHQLRLHASHKLGLGVPIVGDRLYGNGTMPGQLKLHATMLRFTHPVTEQSLEFSVKPLFDIS